MFYNYFEMQYTFDANTFVTVLFAGDGKAKTTLSINILLIWLLYYPVA